MTLVFWLTANLITLFTGFAKTGIPGAGILAAILLANLMEETRQSVGTLLPLLIFADLFAVRAYRRHTDWKVVRRLLPPTLCGVLLGWGLLRHIEAGTFDLLIGGLVLFQLGLDLLRQRLGWHQMPHHALYAVVLGVLAGVTTTLGNMAGPLMTLYFLSIGLDKERFMGSMAWYFLIINLVKVPIFVAEGMIQFGSLFQSLLLTPGVFLGALLGRRLFQHIPTKPFKIVVQVLAAAAAVRLMAMQ
jgi:uncharacterized membrane protein YfcA